LNHLSGQSLLANSAAKHTKPRSVDGKNVHPVLKRFLKIFAAPLVDLLLAPLLAIAAVPMRLFRRIGPQLAPLSRQTLRRAGVWPLRRHYYDPLFIPDDLSKPLEAPRVLAGIDWNVEEQISILRQMSYGTEFRRYLGGPHGDNRHFTLDNDTFLSGDADYLYNFIRLYKPARIIEVGCGNSTLVMHAAELANLGDSPARKCTHTCIEPYENPWLEQVGVTVLRERVESVDMEYFRSLQSGDLLFIDSSHMIRPHGDVTFEILDVLPSLRPGVFVHFHDIFSPREYLRDWILNRGYLWNEQYLLEAFLSCNSQFKIIAALNMLHHGHYEDLASICVQHARTHEPGSFYIQRRATL
jgi:hypothetical protein